MLAHTMGGFRISVVQSCKRCKHIQSLAEVTLLHIQAALK